MAVYLFSSLYVCSYLAGKPAPSCTVSSLENALRHVIVDAPTREREIERKREIEREIEGERKRQREKGRDRESSHGLAVPKLNSHVSITHSYL